MSKDTDERYNHILLISSSSSELHKSLDVLTRDSYEVISDFIALDNGDMSVVVRPKVI